MYRVVQAGTRFPNLPLLPSFLPPAPPLLSPPHDSFFFPCFYSLYLRREKRRRGRNRVAREREKEARMRHDKQRVEWERRVVEGGRGNEVLYPCLSLPRLVHLSLPPPRDSGREEHYNSPSLSPPPFLPTRSRCKPFSLPPPRLLLLLRHFSTPATFPSLVAPPATSSLAP